MQALDLLIREFGQSIDLPELAFDDEDCCALTFDDLAVMLSCRRKQEKLCVYSDVGVIERAPADLLLKLLEANALHRSVGDGVIGVCPDDERHVYVVVYSALFDADSLDLARFDRALHDFVEMAETWRERISDLVLGPGGGGADDSTSDESGRLMRV